MYTSVAVTPAPVRVLTQRPLFLSFAWARPRTFHFALVSTSWMASQCGESVQKPQRRLKLIVFTSRTSEERLSVVNETYATHVNSNADYTIRNCSTRQTQTGLQDLHKHGLLLTHPLISLSIFVITFITCICLIYRLQEPFSSHSLSLPWRCYVTR